VNRRDALKAGVAGLALGLSRFPLGWAAGADAPKRHILVYTRSQAFEHSVVKRGKDGELSLAERILTELGKKHGFEVTTLRRLGGVVSVMASRGINLACEAASDRLDKGALRRLRHLLLLPFSAGGSLALYGLSRLMDGIEQRDAIGWAAMCRRVGN